MKITFFWQGFDGRYGQWKDGLWAALQLLEKDHTVQYLDTSVVEKVHAFNPDVVLYWEAPSTQFGKDAEHWFAIASLPYKKALLFAGGPLRAMDVADFELVFVESRINEEDCECQGVPFRRAFGVNTQIMKPRQSHKLFDGFLPATFAGWKRHELFAQALQNRGCVAGRAQLHDVNGYNECKKRGVLILPEQSAEEIASLINRSYTVVNTSDYWGGGQRCTLEAMACGVPVIVMSDSPKNREFVEESNGGYICDPTPEAIKQTVQFLVDNPEERQQCGMLGHEYISQYWTERHYRDALLEGIQSIL